ncbi:hypothetical protein ECCB7326_3260, partial [Escherichia coli CB7326]
STHRIGTEASANPVGGLVAIK